MEESNASEPLTFTYKGECFTYGSSLIPLMTVFSQSVGHSTTLVWTDISQQCVRGV